VGADATEHASGMLRGRTVHLERDVSNADREGRLLRHVWFLGKQDGRAYLAGELLVRRGYAVASPAPPDVKHAARLAAAQEAARGADRGRWADCGAATPAAPVGPTREAVASTPVAQGLPVRCRACIEVIA
jgi:endonuclease YncB( thermonuclease family)